MKKILLNFLDAIFLLPGIALIAIGIFMIYVPAGYITLGLCLTATAFLIYKSGRRGDD